MYQTYRKTPTWAIVLAVVGALFFLLGLLFLLAKEEYTSGNVQVVVQAPGFMHVCFVPVASQAQGQDVVARVAYARSLAGAFRTA